MAILTRELWTLYETFLKGKKAPLSFLPVQYSDYAEWQRNWLQGDVLDGQLSYWKEKLNDLSILNPPADRPRAKTIHLRNYRRRYHCLHYHCLRQ